MNKYNVENTMKKMSGNTVQKMPVKEAPEMGSAKCRDWMTKATSDSAVKPKITKDTLTRAIFGDKA